MAASEEVIRFVREAFTRGIPRPEIEDVLVKAGWSSVQVKEALANFAAIPFPIPVPKPRPYTDAHEAFLYGVLFVSMYLSAYHIGMLLFTFIDYLLAQSAAAHINLREEMRWPVSLLVVALPVFLYVSRLVSNEGRIDPSKRVSEIRRKLTYFTLFLCASVLISIFAWLIYEFLGGELTIRFILRALTAGGIAGAVFGYYLRDMRLEIPESET